MKNRIMIIAAPALMLCGCSLFHKTQKDKSVQQIDSSSFKTYKNVSIDTGKTVIEKIADTVIHTGKIKFERFFPLKPGLSFPGFASALNSLDTAMLGLNLSYDSLHHAIKVTGEKRSETIPVTIYEKTTVINGKTTVNTAIENASVKKKSEVLHQTTSPDYKWIWCVSGVIIFVLVGFYINKRLKLL